MTDEVHPLVTLLVARAKSHPDEFTNSSNYPSGTISSSDRWWQACNTVSQHGTDADKALMASTVGRLAMDKAHEWALDELLNGEERREMERRTQEEDRKRYAAQQAAMQQQTTSMKQQSQLYGQAAHNSYSNALNNISGATVTGLVGTPNQSVTLTESMLQQIKKALGAK